MAKELKPQTYKRFDVEPIGANNTLEAVIDMAIDVLKAGRPPVYADTPDGLREFKEKTIEYFQYVREVNAKPDIDKPLVVDVEGWACYLSTTRATIATYERSRGEEWQNFIKQTKNAICACKKELAFHSQIPPVVFLFDACNNHNYSNTSEFKIEANTQEPERKPLTAENLPRLPEPPEVGKGGGENDV